MALGRSTTSTPTPPHWFISPGEGEHCPSHRTVSDTAARPRVGAVVVFLFSCVCLGQYLPGMLGQPKLKLDVVVPLGRRCLGRRFGWVGG